MSDDESCYSSCHVSPGAKHCRCCSDHRRRNDRLQAELDAERAAAAESIDMIRRLQREKSDAMVESSQLREQLARYRVEIEALEREMRFKKEQNEKEHKRRKKAEACLYTTIKVARDEDLREQIGTEVYFDLVDHDKVPSFHIQKQWPFTAFKEEVAKEFGIPVQFQRYWLWVKHENHTYRPYRPLAAHEEQQTVGTIREVTNGACNAEAELKLFLEVQFGADLRPLPLPHKSRKDILIFFKLYDPEKAEFCYVGRMFVKAVSKPIEIIAKLKELAGFPADEKIELYKEVNFEPDIACDTIDERLGFKSSELEDGDIIWFQKAISSERDTHYFLPHVPLFLEWVYDHLNEE